MLNVVMQSVVTSIVTLILTKLFALPKFVFFAAVKTKIFTAVNFENAQIYRHKAEKICKIGKKP